MLEVVSQITLVTLGVALIVSLHSPGEGSNIA